MFIILLTVGLLAQSPSPAKSITVTPVVVGEIDLGALKGSARQLGWSPDGTELYLQTIELNRDGSVKATHHYLLSTQSGAAKTIADEPAWAADYWLWKSNRWAPDDQAFAIEMDTVKKLASATATPMAGDMAKGGTVDPTAGTTMESAVSAAQQSQTVNVYSLRLMGEVVGEWTNVRPVPGVTFGWGPKGSNLIAFADKNGGSLVIMDKSGAKKKVDGTKDIMLPAWTADGTRIAYLQNHGHNKYAVVIAGVSR